MAKKKKSFLKFILSLNEVENMLCKTSKIASRNKLNGWYSKNLLIPFLLIFTPYLFSFFIPIIKLTFMDVMLSGGLTILGVSILYSNSSYLVRTKVNLEDQSSTSYKKEKIYESLSTLRDKILNLTNFIVLFSAIMYFIQIVYKPEKEILFTIPIFKFSITIGMVLLISTLVIFYLSIYFGKTIFELSDEFITESSNYEALYSSVEEQEKETEDLMNKLKDNGI